MTLAFLQVTESADSYEPATVALFTLFILMLVITAGLLLRELLQSNPADLPAGLSGLPVGAEAPREIESSGPPIRTSLPVTAPADRRQPSPAWYRQAMSGQSTGATSGVRATIEHMVDAANRGDLRLGFSLYTPELLGREQRSLGLDPGDFERLLREEPQPAQPPLAIAAISEITLDPPDRAYAIVSYRPQGPDARPDERIRFVYDRRNLTWLIDDIENAPS